MNSIASFLGELIFDLIVVGVMEAGKGILFHRRDQPVPGESVRARLARLSRRRAANRAIFQK